MFSSLCNKSGISLIEVLIATLLVMIGVMAMLSMQPQGWVLAGQSDMLGRAAELLHEELERNELHIMNTCNTASLWGAALPANVNSTIQNTTSITSSGQAAVAGDATYTVATTITNRSSLSWLVSVRVTTPGNKTISESRIVARQDYLRQGCI
ncbi:MAG: hypothetical protein JXR79_01570 [Nitrospirae bacterium]|nr:hypothetical protein [Nitrospirota bacterium]